MNENASIKNRHSNYRPKEKNQNKEINHEISALRSPAQVVFARRVFNVPNENVASKVERNFHHDTIRNYNFHNNGTSYNNVCHQEESIQIIPTSSIQGKPQFQETPSLSFSSNYSPLVTEKVATISRHNNSSFGSLNFASNYSPLTEKNSTISHNTNSNFGNLNDSFLSSCNGPTMQTDYYMPVTTQIDYYTPVQNDYGFVFPQNAVIPANDCIDGYSSSFKNNSLSDFGFVDANISGVQSMNSSSHQSPLQNLNFITEANAQTMKHSIETPNFVQNQNLNSFNDQSSLADAENHNFQNESSNDFIFNGRTMTLPYEHKSTIRPTPTKLNNSKHSPESPVDIQFGLNLNDQEMANIIRIASLSVPNESFSQIAKVDSVDSMGINAPASSTTTHRRVNIMQNYKKVADVANASIENVAQQLYNLNQITKQNENVYEMNTSKEHDRKANAICKKCPTKMKKKPSDVTLSYDENSLTIKVQDDCFINFDEKSTLIFLLLKTLITLGDKFLIFIPASEDVYQQKLPPITIKKPPAVGILKRRQHCFTRSENSVQFFKKGQKPASIPRPITPPTLQRKRVSFSGVE